MPISQLLWILVWSSEDGCVHLCVRMRALGLEPRVHARQIPYQQSYPRSLISSFDIAKTLRVVLRKGTVCTGDMGIGFSREDWLSVLAYGLSTQ